MKIPNDYDLRMGLQQVVIDDHFTEYNTARWNAVTGDGGASVVKDATTPFGGGLRLATGATNNNENYVYSNPIFKFGSQVGLRGLLALTTNEAATNANAWFAGFLSGVAGDAIVDGGLTLAASSYGALFYKQKGSNFIRCWAAAGGAVLIDALTEIPSTGRNVLEIGIMPTVGNKALITYQIDQLGGQHPQAAYKANKVVINQEIDFGASPTALSLGFGQKTGGATSEIMLADYAGAAQRLGY
jgi:hypothetical protein